MSVLTLNIPPVELNVAQFETLIKQRGMPVAWEKAAMCPCVRADTTSGRPSFNCGECYNGNRYVDRQEIIGAITNITGQRNAQVFGDLAVGGLYITVSGEYRLGINDRITMLTQTARYAELVELTSVKTKVPASPGDTTLTVEHTRKVPVPPPGNPGMYCTVVVDGQAIRYTGKTVNTLTGIPSGTQPGAITAPIASNSTVQVREVDLRYPPVAIFDARSETAALRRYTDYDLIQERRIRLLGAAPPTRFTLLYDARPVYLVDQLAHEYRDQTLSLGVVRPTMTRFPVAAVLRKDLSLIPRG